MNRHGHNNIRNGIVWVQTGYSTCTCTVTQHVIGPRTHQKYESSEKFSETTIIEFESANQFQKNETFELISATWYPQMPRGSSGCALSTHQTLTCFFSSGLRGAGSWSTGCRRPPHKVQLRSISFWRWEERGRGGLFTFFVQRFVPRGADAEMLRS